MGVAPQLANSRTQSHTVQGDRRSVNCLVKLLHRNGDRVARDALDDDLNRLRP